MKKTFKFILAAFAIVTAASCAQEIEDPDALPQEEVELVPMTITVGGEATKTTVGENNAINWCADDEIAVFDNTGAARKFTIVEGTLEGNTARFEGEVAAGSTDFTAVYPFSAAVSVADGAVTVNTPDVQVLDGATIADGATVSVAQFTKDNAEFTFKTAIGYLRVDVKEADVTSIIVKGTNIAGQASFNAAGELQSVVEGKNQVTLTPAAGEVFTNGTSYYVTVLPGKYAAEDFSITLVRETELAAELAATKEVTILRNQGFFLDSGKLSYKFVIKDAQTLQKFLDNAADYTAKDKAEIVNDIDLTGVTLTSAESFKGTLDGGGHNLKNWTSNATALFTIYSGIVKNIILDSSCKLTPLTGKEQFGFIAKTISKFGVMENCVNNADIVYEASTMGKTFWGSLVGVSYGTIINCVNNGDITISISGNVTDNCAIGGLVGYINVMDQFADKGDEYKIAFDNCKNYGNITYTVDGTVKYLIMGGVAGGTSYNTIATAVFKGIAKDCLNEGNISYTFKNGGVLDDDKGSLAEGNYTNVGGLFGYWEGSIENCVNGAMADNKVDVTKGNVSMVFPTNESKACASRPAVAGISAFVLQNMGGCTNYGKVYVKGTSSGGNVANSGSGVTGEVCAGGVVAQIGPSGDGSQFSLSNCHNYGELDFNTWMASGNGTGYNHGGVAGYCKVSMSDCSNHGKMTVVSKGSYNYTGGVVGQAVYAGNSLKNHGDLNFTFKKTTSGSNQIKNNLHVGGVIGRCSGVNKVINLSNEAGTMTVTAVSVDGIAALPHVAGVVGYYEGSATMEDCTNMASIEFTSPRQTGQMYLGGILGRSTDTKRTYLRLKNYGSINATVLTSSNGSFNYIGGVAGTDRQNQTYSYCENYGNIGFEGVMKMRIGGISAYMNQTANNSIVKADITAKCTNNNYSEIGGVVAYTAATSLNDWTYEGSIDTSESTAKVYTGGLLGKSNGKSNFNGCSFKGEIKTAEGNNAPGLYVGGLQADKLAMTFGNSAQCTVASGSKLNNSEVTQLNLNNLVSQSSDSGTYTSTATLTNIIIK